MLNKIYRVVFTLVCWLSVLIATLMASLVVLVGTILPKSWHEVALHNTARGWGDFLVWSNLGRVRVLKTKPVYEHPVIFMSNHLSWCDIPVLLSTLPRGLRFLSKKEVFNVPFMGYAMRALKYISVDRQNRNAAVESVRAAGRVIRDEKLSVWVAPEGTRSPDGNLGAFKKGPFHLALSAQVPIVPVLLKGTEEVIAKGSLLVGSRAVIDVVMGEPFTAHIDSEMELESLKEMIRSQLQELARQRNDWDEKGLLPKAPVLGRKSFLLADILQRDT